MDTKIISADSADREEIQKLGEILRAGGLVAFPTETVYGLGGNALDAAAAKKIYAAKGRPSDNPLIVHVADLAQAETVAAALSPLERELIEDFWPGPLTLVVPKREEIPAETSGGLSTVAIRCPAHPAALALLRAAGVPIAGPSANRSGKPSPTRAADVMADLGGRIDAILDGGQCAVGLESTIISCAGDTITIYRPGAVTKEMLENFAPVTVDKALKDSKAPPKAPGMKYRHYAPAAPMTVYAGDAEKAETAILSRAAEGKNYGYFVSEETAEKLPAASVIFRWGKRGDRESFAHRLFEGLHFFDAHPVAEIIGEGTDESGIGLAIMNRLTKASGYHIIVENKN